VNDHPDLDAVWGMSACIEAIARWLGAYYV